MNAEQEWEHIVRELDRLVMENGPRITAEHPEDHGLEPWVAREIVRIRNKERDHE